VKKFSGIRDDTAVTKEYAELGYLKRSDGSVFPKLTSIPVNKRTREVYAFLRELGKFHNYDELLVGVAYCLLEYEGLPSTKGVIALETSVAKKMKLKLELSEQLIRLRKKARTRASGKRRYYRRKTLAP